MLVDIKIKNPKDIKQDSILISKDGKTFEIVDKEHLIKHYEKQNDTLNKRMLNLEKDMKKQRQDFDAKIKKFVIAFTKGGK